MRKIKKAITKLYQRWLIVMILVMAMTTAFFWYVSQQNEEYQVEIEKANNQSYNEQDDRDYGRKIDKPLYYHIIIDTRRSMLVNFDNFEDHMKDELIEMAALLAKKDYLAVYMMNEDKEKVILSGEASFEENAQLIRDLVFTFDDAGDVDRTVTTSEQDFAKLHDAYYTRRVIITDRSAAELAKTILGKEKKVHWANMTDIVLSDSNMVAGYASLDEIFFAHTLGKNNSFIENILEDEFFFAFSRLKRFSVANEDDRVFSFNFSVDLPQKTDRLVVILSEEDMLLTGISLEKQVSEVYGTTLSDGRRILVTTTKNAAENCRAFFSFGQSGTLIYPSDHGYSVERFNYYYIPPEWEADLNRWDLISIWQGTSKYGYSYSRLLGSIEKKHVLFFGLITLGFILLLIISKLLGIYRQKRLRLKQNVFISYRRSGTSMLAHSINDQLHNKKIKTFMDIENLSSGDYESVIVDSLKKSACMVLVLPVDGLNTCLYQKEDWIRKEVSLAIQYRIPIIPVLMKGFIWPQRLPDEMEKLRTYNAVYFDEQLNYSGCMRQVLGFVMNELENHGLEFNRDDDNEYAYDEEEAQQVMDEEFYSYMKARSSKDSKNRKSFTDRMLEIMKLDFDDLEFQEDDDFEDDEESYERSEETAQKNEEKDK